MIEIAFDSSPNEKEIGCGWRERASLLAEGF